jgi:hypothetical protein
MALRRRLPMLFVLTVFVLLAWGRHSREQTRRDAFGGRVVTLRVPHLAAPRVTPAARAAEVRPAPVTTPATPARVSSASTATSAAAARGRDGRPLTPIDMPMAQAWPAVNQWSDTMEREYDDFVAGLGRAVSQHRCRQLDDCLRNPGANTLYDARTDAAFDLHVDCADLPYVLRAYFAFKRRLPFGFVAAIRGDAGRDPRYTLNIRPDGFRTWQQFPTPRALLRDIGSMVHSGMYRMAPPIEDSDFYQAAVSRRAIHPGTIFYDPNGHVLVVTEVRADGQIYLMDGHPDGTLTYKRFGEAFVTGTARLGGGFKNFRPLRWQNGRITRARNAELPLFDGNAQFDRTGYLVDGNVSGYHAWIRASLRDGSTPIDPVEDFREQVRALCRDVSDRVDAVNIAVAANIHTQSHPDALPENIYGTDGDWETYSTPSRDARLKASFRELFESVQSRTDRVALAPSLEAAWHEEVARPECQFQYARSDGSTAHLTLDTVLDRIYKMSFDPYQCVELRWGAVPGSDEAATCHDDATRMRWYFDEQRLRNRIDREYGVPTPLVSGPAAGSDIDVRRLLRHLIAGQTT